MEHRTGFTLVEMLIAVSILAIVLGVVTLSFRDTHASVDISKLVQDASHVALYVEQLASLEYPLDEIGEALVEEFGASDPLPFFVGSYPYLATRLRGTDLCAHTSFSSFVTEIYSQGITTDFYSSSLPYTGVAQGLHGISDAIACVSDDTSSDFFFFLSYPSIPRSDCVTSLTSPGVYLFEIYGARGSDARDGVCLYPISVL